MLKVHVIVEGQTERAVIQQVFAPDLANQGILLNPRISAQSPDRRQAGKEGRRLQIQASSAGDMHSAFAGERFVRYDVFRYYGLPNDWPNREESCKLSLYQQKANEIEVGLKKAVLGQFKKIDPKRFIPYIQMHELEALLFADSQVMGDLLEADGTLFQKRLNDFDGPCEAINDSSTTAPSKRIMEIVPFYKKGSSVNAHGWRILKQIGLQKIRERCPHFNDWIEELEQLQRAK